MLRPMLGLLCALSLLANTSLAAAEGAVEASASPSAWKLPAHLVPDAVDPRDIFMTAGDHQNPLPDPCRVTQSRDGDGVFETLELLSEDEKITSTLNNTLSGLSVTIEFSEALDGGGLPKWTKVTTSEGDEDKCTYSHDKAGRRTQKKCTESCSKYSYDKQGRLTVVLESMGACEKWSEGVSYSYEGDHRLPSKVSYCEDAKLKKCPATLTADLDADDRTTRLIFAQERKTVSVTTFDYADNGLLIAAHEVDGEGAKLADETFGYDEAGTHLLTIVRDRAGKPTKTTTFTYDCK